MNTWNTLKTTALLVGMTMVLLAAGAAFGGRQGMTIALIFALLINGISYFFSDKIALRMSKAQPVNREQAPRFYSITERLCARAGLPLPRLYAIPEAAPNAFATGRNPKNSAVAATVGLLELMDDEELEGVIAHELAHVRNYDILTASVAAALAGAITWLAHMGQFALIFGGGSSRDDRGGNPLGLLLMVILAPIAAILVQMGISRQREYAADRGAARMIGHPHGLIRALGKLGSYNKRIPMHTSPETASLFIVAPLGGRGSMMSWFSTHPPLEKRIEALKSLA